MFEKACRPVLFEQDDDECPYWGRGSSFLVSNSNHHYWVTAAHVVKDVSGAPENIRIYPADDSRISIPFNEAYRIPVEAPEDYEDYKDLYAARIDLEHFKLTGDAALITQDIDYAVIPAENLSRGSKLVVVGYPSESRSINYDDFKIRFKREILPARYVEPGIDSFTHKLQFHEDVQVDDYDGLSGAPVFHYKYKLLPNMVNPALLACLAGVVLRAGGVDRWGYFVSSTVLQNLVKKAEKASDA